MTEEPNTSASETPSDDAAPVDSVDNPTGEVVESSVAESSVAESSVAESSVAESSVPETSASEASATDAKAVATADVESASSDEENNDTEGTGNEDSPTLFVDLELNQSLQLAIRESGYIHPTPIQEQIIPHILSGRDVLAQSQTGTGKTAAFALPLLNQISGRAKLPRILVLTPTRELAMQVANSFETYGAHLPMLRTVMLYGGTDYESQLRKLARGVHVVVGTPGRVMDHIKRKSLILDGLEAVVLDEADEMLNLGFIEDIQWILDKAPDQRQTALFSATMPAPIQRVAEQYLNEPAHVTIRQQTLTAETVEQRCVFIEERFKRDLLARLLELETTDGVLVFTKTKDATVSLASHLVSLGFKSAALNGDLPQARRQKTVEELKNGRLDILVATDVAARGLDVQRISHVFNFDLPHDSESYVHRIGRTGRAGRTGVSYIFLTARERRKLRTIEKTTRQQITVEKPPGKERISAARITEFRNKIDQALIDPELKQYRQIIEEHIQESGADLGDVAAALVCLSQGTRPLFVEDLPTLTDKPRFQDQRERGKRPRGGRNFKNSGPRCRYWVGVGKRDGVRPGNLVGAIANEVGIPGTEIGPIRIQDSFSTVELAADLPQDVVHLLQRTWVAGKQLRLRVFSDSEARSTPHSPSSGFKGRRGPAGSRPGPGSRKPTGSRKPPGSRKPAGAPPTGKKPGKKKRSSAGPTDPADLIAAYDESVKRKKRRPIGGKHPSKKRPKGKKN